MAAPSEIHPELTRIKERVNSLFEQALFLGRYGELDDGPPGGWAPEIDVVETAEAYLLRAELPGVRRQDVELEVDGRRLQLSGRRQPVTEKGNFLRMERSYGPFRRELELGAAVAADAVTARLRRGVLEVVLPKRRRRRQIEVEEEEG